MSFQLIYRKTTSSKMKSQLATSISYRVQGWIETLNIITLCMKVFSITPQCTMRAKAVVIPLPLTQKFRLVVRITFKLIRLSNGLFHLSLQDWQLSYRENQSLKSRHGLINKDTTNYVTTWLKNKERMSRNRLKRFTGILREQHASMSTLMNVLMN